MGDFSFEDFNFGSGNEEYDFSGLADIGGGGQDIDFSGFDNLDISSLLGGDGQGIDLSALGTDTQELDFSSLLGGGDQGIDFGSLDAGEGAFDLSALLSTEGGAEALSRSLASLASDDKDTSGGTGLRATGRGQLSMIDELTGATGITGEGFTSLKDLLGSGTAEEIARYSPETVDYGFRSGLETEGGQGLSGDSTRGMGLSGNGKNDMGGAQGLSKYIPAQYSESALTDLVKNNPGKFPEIENYLDSQYDIKGLTPFRGSGGTLSETGFLAQSSKANPLGSMYAIGNPKSFINNPTITGQQSVVSPGRTIIDNKDGTYKVVTTTSDGTKTITTNKDGVDKIIRETKTIDNTKANAGAKAAAADKKDNNMLLMLLALMAMMNKGGDSKGSGAVIPSLSADRRQLPYGPASGSTARPGAGGVTYFSPTTYSPKAAGGGLTSLAGGGVTKMAIGGDTKKALEDAYANKQYDIVNNLVAQNKITDADVRGTWGMDTSGLAGLGVNLYQPPTAVDANQLDYFGNPKNTQAANTQTTNVQNLPFIPDNNAFNTPTVNPVDTEIFDYFTRNQDLVKNKDYNKIASDMYISGWTPEMAARATGTNVADFTREYDKTYGAFDRATQEDLVNQKYKKQLGLTDEQLGQRYFGAPMDTRENRSTSRPFSNAYEKYQEELALTGRRDAPAGTQFRTQAVFEPGALNGRGMIKLYDTATGQHLTNAGYGAHGLLDKFAVDPASYRKAVTQMYEASGKPEHMKDDYARSLGYKPRDTAAATNAYITKPLEKATVADLRAKYEKDANNKQTADSKINVFYEIPMTKLLTSKGLSGDEAYGLLSQLRPVAGLVNFAEISRSKDPVKAMIGTLNYLQSKGVINLDPNTGPFSKIGQTRLDASGKRLPALYTGAESLRSLGLRGFASGGISSLGVAPQMSNLGGYSDGGRLLKGPGDGVSDSIPATIGGKQPARLAEGEFVVPARIVSELGNGSTNAGAQKLYAMMDRVQKARRKTKNVAADTKAHKYLPA
jgi:hypothetical protein